MKKANRILPDSSRRHPLVLSFMCLFYFLTALGLSCCTKAFSCCSDQGPLLTAVHGGFTVAASMVHRLSSCGDSIGSSPPGSVPGILQARTLEWVAISFSIVWKWKVKVKSLCRVRLVATPWTAAHQAPPSMGFSRQQYWSGLPLPSPIQNILMSYFYSPNVYKLHCFQILINKAFGISLRGWPRVFPSGWSKMQIERNDFFWVIDDSMSGNRNILQNLCSS